MFIPIAQIPGCQPYYKFDNPSQSREPVTLRFGSLPTHEAAAEFYAYLAYHDPNEVTEREKYRIALSRWAVIERAKLDKNWNQSADVSIRPLIFSQPEKLFLKTYERGGKIWWRRGIYASMMLLPQLALEDDGLPPTVTNITLAACRSFGCSGGSQKTIESRFWSPTKPIAHAAAAAMLWFSVLRDPAHEWDDDHRLCLQQPFLATLFYEDVFRQVLLTAEYLRLQLPACDRFHIREGDSIQFIAGFGEPTKPLPAAAARLRREGASRAELEGCGCRRLARQMGSEPDADQPLDAQVRSIGSARRRAGAFGPWVDEIDRSPAGS